MRPYIIFTIIVLLTACSPVPPPLSTSSEIQPIPDTPEGGVSRTTPTIATPSYDPGLQSLLEKAKLDLAQRLNIAESKTSVLDAREVVWPDSSLGCPQPGIMYTQVLTEGFLIRLEADGELYEYHTDANDQVVFCENPELPVIPITPGEIDDDQPWVPVN